MPLFTKDEHICVHYLLVIVITVEYQIPLNRKESHTTWHMLFLIQFMIIYSLEGVENCSLGGTVYNSAWLLYMHITSAIMWVYGRCSLGFSNICTLFLCPYNTKVYLSFKKEKRKHLWIMLDISSINGTHVDLDMCLHTFITHPN